MVDKEVSEWVERRLRAASERLEALAKEHPEHPLSLKIVHQAAVLNGTADVLEREINGSGRAAA